MKRWYSATELAALKLPGIPTTKRGIHRRAVRENWRWRPRRRRGGGREYHLPSIQGSISAAETWRRATKPTWRRRVLIAVARRLDSLGRRLRRTARRLRGGPK